MSRWRNRAIPGVEQLDDRTVPAVYIVNTLADTGAGSLRTAITDGNAAGGSHTIKFAITFPEPQTSGAIVLASALPALDASFTMNGPGTSILSIERNPNAENFRIFEILANNTCSFTGLTISGGRTSHSDGAGILNRASLTLTSCRLTDNQSGRDGGAIYNMGSATLTTSLCEVYGNSANPANSGFGGGIGGGGTVNIYGCNIYDNAASLGGGLGVGGGTWTIATSTAIYCNDAAAGGGIYINACSSFSMSGGSVDHNSAVGANGEGGGLAVKADASNVIMTNVSITDNEANGANGKGGGFYIYDEAFITFNSCTISGNSATAAGDGGLVKGDGCYTTDGQCTINDDIDEED
jgi:hypothetical protein